MSFGAGFAAGIGAGIAIGIHSGAKQTRDKLDKYFESESLTLRDQQGNQVAIDDALDKALRGADQRGRRPANAVLAFGLLVVMCIGVAIYLLVGRG